MLFLQLCYYMPVQTEKHLINVSVYRLFWYFEFSTVVTFNSIRCCILTILYQSRSYVFVCVRIENPPVQPSFVEAVGTGRQWINNLLIAPLNNLTYQLTVNWTGRYQALDPMWMLAATREGPPDISLTIDDIYGKRQVT